MTGQGMAAPRRRLDPGAVPVGPAPRRALGYSALRRRRHRRARQRGRLGRTLVVIMVSVVVGWTALGLSWGLVMNTAYADRAIPGSMLAGHDISGMTVAQIAPVLDQIESEISLTVTVRGRSHQGSGADLGIAVDQAQTLAGLSESSRQPLWTLGITPKTTLSLAVSIDQERLQTWLIAHFPADFAWPVDAQPVFEPDPGQYRFEPAQPGRGVSPDDLAALSAALAASTQASVELVPVAQPAAIDDAQATAVVTRANQRLGAQCSLLADGQPVYTVTPGDIAAMTTISADPDQGLLLTTNTDAVAGFVRDTVGPLVNTEPVTEEQISDPVGGSVRVTQPGVPGRALAEPDQVAEQLAACLSAPSPQPTDVALTLTSQPYGVDTAVLPTRTPPDGSADAHWADVNLTTQTVTLMDGASPQATLTISSGAPAHPTPTGVFHVYAKIASQPISGCVDGDCYYYPDVPWVLWYFEDYGFHTAYWHNNFGTPVSHGCLNLPEADALTVYEWLSTGDAVDVHD
jgi:lipoprotein-anchoring transpeptidase ErfK/SrfK